MKQTFALLLAVCLTAGAVIAQDNPADNNTENQGRRSSQRFRQRGGERNGNGPGMMMRMPGPFLNGMSPSQDPRAEAEAKIKEKFPAEYTEIVKQRKELEEKLQALAGKAGVKLPLSEEARREKMENFRTKYAKELSEIETLRKSDPREAMEKMRALLEKEGLDMPFNNLHGRRSFRGNDNDRRDGKAEDGNSLPPPRVNRMEEMREELKARYPEKFAQVESLREENPREYRKQFMELVKQYNQDKNTAK